MNQLEVNHNKNVIPFRGLYDEITNSLNEYANNGKFEDHFKLWITNLVNRFEDRYQHWIDNEKEFLSVIYSKQDKLFHLTGLAYIHILYDLPIVIAESFKNIPINTIQSYFRIYSGLHDVIVSCFKKNWKSKPIIFKLVDSETQGLGIDHWLSSFRDRSWLNALIILNYSDADREVKLYEYKVLILEQLIQANKLVKSCSINSKAILMLRAKNVLAPASSVIIIIFWIAGILELSSPIVLVLISGKYILDLIESSMSNYFEKLEPIDISNNKTK